MYTRLSGGNVGLEKVVSQHYFSRKPFRKGKKRYISLYIHGYMFEFLTYSSLFSGRDIDLGTRLLLENIRLPSEGNALDIGCGYGVIGIVVAKLNPRLKVYMVDINELAVKTAKYNASLNGVADKVVILKGNLYEPVKDMVFKAIYSNPPLSAGRNIVDKLVTDAEKHLCNKGFLQIVLAKGHEYYIELLKKIYTRVEWKSKKGYLIITAYK